MAEALGQALADLLEGRAVPVDARDAGFQQEALGDQLGEELGLVRSASPTESARPITSAVATECGSSMAIFDEHISGSVEETEAVAAELAGSLTGGQCLTLCGDLGAGKTQFVRGLVRGLGGNARAVSSPTYILLNVYDTGRLPVYHLDAYRVCGAEDFEAIGFTELLEQGSVVLVEWAERVWSLLPPDRIEVRITALGQDSRQIEITGSTC